jgi:hypothetical protein
MALMQFEALDAGVSLSGKGEKISMTIRVGLPADRLYRHQNLVSLGERRFIWYIHSLKWVSLIQ